MISLFPNAYPRYNQLFTRQTIQNGVLSAKNAMPLKNASTATDDAVFSIDRYKYTRIYENVPQNNTAVTYANIASGGVNINTGRNVAQTNTVKSNMKDLKKKWYGNRDASQIVANRRVQAVGQGTLNPANTPLSFLSKNDRNIQRDAKKRARSGGAAVPAKVTHKYKNAPIFY